VKRSHTSTWVITLEYPGVLPSGCRDEADPGDSRVTPLAISTIGDQSTHLSAFVTAATAEQAHEIGVAGVGRWAELIGLDPREPVVVSLAPRRPPRSK
jgi:hypothetical protein